MSETTFETAFSDGTDDVVQTDASTEVEAPAAAAASGDKRRGRPRSQETIERDDLVLQLLSDGVARTRDEIAEELSVDKGSIVYLSLYRLRNAGKVQRVEVAGQRFAWTVA